MDFAGVFIKYITFAVKWWIVTYHSNSRIIDDTIEKFKKLIDDSGKKVYSNDREAHLAAIKSLGKDYGIWYETR